MIQRNVEEFSRLQRYMLADGKDAKAYQEMNEQEMKRVAIEKYVNIQRIKKHGQEEIDYQERIAKTELQLLGINTEDLEMDK